MSFYKDLFEKVHVKADFLPMGEAKARPSRTPATGMSPESRKQYDLVLDDLYEKGIVQTIVESRAGQKWDAPRVQKLIDEAPYTAKQGEGTRAGRPRSPTSTRFEELDQDGPRGPT